ncbi:site-specific DNA-methyltransferase [Micrococcus luteus]|uniref:site-specific DNA-methyltransferase n=1 Tax=Micrococcus luteus TaxID=1270 RepID=UPI0036A6F6D0
MEPVRRTSPDLTADNVRRLAELFPSVITETRDDAGDVRPAVDFDLLRQELSDHVVEGPQERYQLDWPGKRAAAFAANAPTTATLRPDRGESVDFDTTKNVFIEGDNLEVLKVLQDSYLGRIKTIFIDPPYNTQGDLIYPDDFLQSSAEYLALAREVDADGRRLRANTSDSGRVHSNWLSMMYPRLKLARNLLRDDGSIFVAIDQNEVASLRLLMDEIFGADNFQREIVWRIGWISGYKSAANNFIRNHDTILFYSRNSNLIDFQKEYIENKDFKPLVRDSPAFSSFMTELGIYPRDKSRLLKFINHENRPDRYPIEDTWNSNEYDDLNSIAIVSFSGEKVSKTVGLDHEFRGQKSVAMLKRILGATLRDGDIVLDFFAGTASTAVAALEMSAERGINLRHIMVQIAEDISHKSNSHRTISEIARQRLRLLDSQSTATLTGSTVDTGFRAYRLDASPFVERSFTPESTTPDMLASLEAPLLPDRTPEDLLTHVLLAWGLGLAVDIATVRLAGQDVFDVEDGALLAALGAEVTDDLAHAMAQREPARAVFLDSGFASDAARINVEQIFREVSPDTEIKVL